MGNNMSNRNHFVQSALRGKTTQLPGKAKKLGVHVDDSDAEGITALMAAAYAGHAATVQTLIDMNCDVNVAREKPSKSKLDKYNGYTALIIAVATKHFHIVRILVETGHASIGLINPQGKTAIQMAYEMEQMKMGDYLHEWYHNPFGPIMASNKQQVVQLPIPTSSPSPPSPTRMTYQQRKDKLLLSHSRSRSSDSAAAGITTVNESPSHHRHHHRDHGKDLIPEINLSSQSDSSSEDQYDQREDRYLQAPSLRMLASKSDSMSSSFDCAEGGTGTESESDCWSPLSNQSSENQQKLYGGLVETKTHHEDKARVSSSLVDVYYITQERPMSSASFKKKTMVGTEGEGEDGQVDEEGEEVGDGYVTL